jgi:hypothetical protein
MARTGASPLSVCERPAVRLGRGHRSQDAARRIVGRRDHASSGRPFRWREFRCQFLSSERPDFTPQIGDNNYCNISFLEPGGWRRGRDSNPRYGCPYAAFRVRCIQPLCHLSKPLRLQHNQCLRRSRKGPVATLLLPNRFGAPVYYVLQVAVNASGCVLLHPRHNVRIKVQGDSDLGVPEALAGDLGMDAGR